MVIRGKDPISHKGVNYLTRKNTVNFYNECTKYDPETQDPIDLDRQLRSDISAVSNTTPLTNHLDTKTTKSTCCSVSFVDKLVLIRAKSESKINDN